MGSGDADDAASDATASIASGRGKLVAADTKVIDVGVADHGASNDGVRSVKHEKSVGHVNGSLAVFASDYVTEITVVTDFAVGSTMDNLLGVPVRASSGASVDEVS